MLFNGSPYLTNIQLFNHKSIGCILATTTRICDTSKQSRPTILFRSCFPQGLSTFKKIVGARVNKGRSNRSFRNGFENAAF